jgi:septum formation inhibitor-activating ATPase MinD
LAFAKSGVRTLVIDTDMRRGRLHRLFGYRPSPGLGDVLAGEIPAEKAIRATPHENLYVLNAGKSPEPSAGLLTSDTFAKTITQLRDSLYLLIFDAPPCARSQCDCGPRPARRRRNKLLCRPRKIPCARQARQFKVCAKMERKFAASY